jgi:antitoxin component YwqK of YwqJK toxin-antitoxin module
MAQEDDCFRIDSVTMIAYDNQTDSLYTGDCVDHYNNGQLRCRTIFENGIVKTSKNWDKKGNLLDSIIYNEGFFKSSEYHL